MAPAPTKVLKSDHGLHPSSPASVISTSHGRHTELEPQLMLTEDVDFQKMWLNVSLLSGLDSCVPMSLDVAPVPYMQASASQYETVSSPSPSSLLGFLSFNKGPSDSHQGASVLSGAPGMLVGLGHGLQRGCGPDGADAHHSSLTQGYTSHTETQEVTQHCSDRSNVDAPALEEQVSRQARLHSRAWGLQKRLQAALAEHAVLHCDQQVEGLERHSWLDDVHSGLVPARADSEPGVSWPDLSPASSLWTELREFCCSNKAMLRTLQESLDSDATASSSSDEELEERWSYSKTKNTLPASNGSSCERHWLEERAELGSRWSWLQLRLAELEGRIQQLVELHKRILSSKSGVVLAHPLKDRKTQQNLMMEMGGLSCTATEADAEPCSPMRLLYNIERQSAQLSQIVNSLMFPLSFSPLSKQAQAWKGASSFQSGQKADNGVMTGSSKRTKLGSRMLFKADVSCVCARTQPLVAYHKPRLFTFNTHSPSSSQDSGQLTFSSSSSLLPSSCSCCSSCDPVALCTDPECGSSWTRSSRNPSSSSHHKAPSYHMQRSMSREEWSPRPLVTDNQSSAPLHYKRCSSTPLRSSHKHKHHKSNVMGLSPIKRPGSALSLSRRANQRKRKRKCTQQHIEDEKSSLYRLCDLQESSDELLEGSSTRKQASEGFVRKLQGESVYNIDNTVIPMCLAKVEKLQYKSILTPSWRMVDSYSLGESEAQKREDCEERPVEDLSDEVFAQRHLALEQREKLRWSSWGKRTCCRRPTRSGGRLSGTAGTICTSGEESSVEWSSAQLETDEQPSSDEWLPRAPWEPRMFPLDKDKEEALLCYDLEKVPAGWSDSSSGFSASQNSNPHASTVHACGVRLPPGGQTW